MLREKDVVIRQKDEALKEKDEALKEKDEALKEKDEALKEKDIVDVMRAIQADIQQLRGQNSIIRQQLTVKDEECRLKGGEVIRDKDNVMREL